MQRYILAILLFLSAAWPIKILGEMYFLDVYIIIFALLVIISKTLYIFRKKASFIIILISFLIPWGLLCDYINSIPSDDVCRGIARNSIFLMSFILTQYILNCYKFNRSILLITSSYISFPLIYIITQQDLGPHCVEFIKKGYGVYLLLPVFWILRYRLLLLGLLMLSISLFTIIYLDARLAGIWIFLVGVGTINRNHLTAASNNNKNNMMVLICGLILFITIFVLYSNSSYNIFADRQSTSNNERIDMAINAWNGFLTNPFFGHGTWQHARNWVCEYNATITIGVHSWVLQLAYEYGVYGLIVSLLIILVLLLCVYYIVFNKIPNSILPEIYTPFVLLFLIPSITLIAIAPFNGPSRFFEGISLAVALSLIEKRKC